MNFLMYSMSSQTIDYSLCSFGSLGVLGYYEFAPRFIHVE